MNRGFPRARVADPPFFLFPICFLMVSFFFLFGTLRKTLLISDRGHDPPPLSLEFATTSCWVSPFRFLVMPTFIQLRLLVSHLDFWLSFLPEQPFFPFQGLTSGLVQLHFNGQTPPLLCNPCIFRIFPLVFELGSLERGPPLPLFAVYHAFFSNESRF